MHAAYEHSPALTFIGFSTVIAPDEGYEKCPAFWDEAFNKRFARLFHTMRPETPLEQAVLDNQIGMFAICADEIDRFTYWIAGLYRGGAVPEGLSLFTCPESDWAVFSAKGALPASLQTLNAAIIRDWFPTEGKAHGASPDLMIEYYSPGDPRSPDYMCGIRIPVEK